MRKEAAVALVTVVLAAVGATAAEAASPTLLGEWRLDEGAGQVAADTSAFGHDGRLGSSSGPDAADPQWIAGHDGGHALRFDGSSYVAIPDTPTLEPAQVAVDAWVRRSRSPGRFRYVLSKGALDCDRSAYGLYSGWSGGIGFYVSDATRYTNSPELGPEDIWDGRWHHVMGGYDGQRVRLWVDDAQVGDGTPVRTTIAYGSGSKGVYIGLYRGSCDLAFTGAIDDVRVWSGPPVDPSQGGPVLPPVPGTPVQTDVSRPRAVDGPTVTRGPQPSSTAAPRACLMLRVRQRSIRSGRRVRLVASVRRGRRPAARVPVVVGGAGRPTSARTDRRGTARIVVRVRARGRLVVRLGRRYSACSSPTVRVL